MKFQKLEIRSPKRGREGRGGWGAFFPYYAGFPESFARALIESAQLPPTAITLDPWNGSGTTTYAASRLGLQSIGFDLNPVMVVIAKARALAPAEADCLHPLAAEITRQTRLVENEYSPTDPLLSWFDPASAFAIRKIEMSIRTLLVGKRTLGPTGTKLAHISPIAATFYVALFDVCNTLTRRFRSTNPTWVRRVRDPQARVTVLPEELQCQFLCTVDGMAASLASQADLLAIERARADIDVGDSTSLALSTASVDFILTSPPYCTRIDYTSGTRVQLAVMDPLVDDCPQDVRNRMLGSVIAPRSEIQIRSQWGSTCLRFLAALRRHPSKASTGYYLRTHLDYFDKIDKSLCNLGRVLKVGGTAILVVQDSYYKEVHNDLPTIIAEIASHHGLILGRRDSFSSPQTMAGINPKVRRYRTTSQAVEAVLCFSRSCLS